MPMNGHTSGVSVLGSDEKRAEKRRPWRWTGNANRQWMRRDLDRVKFDDWVS